MRLTIDTPAQMQELAACCAANLPPGFKLYLQGELGAGKTTFVRGALRGLGYQGVVKSPTYTLVEHYPVAGVEVCHFDLYRLATAAELDDIGYRDYFDGRAICLVEWPERGGASLPVADLTIDIGMEQAARSLHCRAQTEAGRECLQKLTPASSTD
ncbi:MAG: tRNA (adenosine(37)-N6)-threonylcarbamoyltransferase complex ATPase subunit type 1 TsaE [Gammaproteobacteria bacterium]|nr:tRNA (adenosine(37)-N6)-threonylcarbamoyltransferase complex ATPase subunit type 1 TsaE [Gammaproteobacteria bacterium]